jgi:hypothetical protein
LEQAGLAAHQERLDTALSVPIRYLPLSPPQAVDLAALTLQILQAAMAVRAAVRAISTAQAAAIRAALEIHHQPPRRKEIMAVLAQQVIFHLAAAAAQAQQAAALLRLLVVVAAQVQVQALQVLRLLTQAAAAVLDKQLAALEALAVVVVGTVGMVEGQELSEPLIQAAAAAGHATKLENKAVPALSLSRYPTPTPQHFQAALRKPQQQLLVLKFTQ